MKLKILRILCKIPQKYHKTFLNLCGSLPPAKCKEEEYKGTNWKFY